MENIYKSFQNLANYNNGIFKSEKQAEFLTKYADERDGCIGHLKGNGNPVFVKLDDKGILEMYYQSKTKKGFTYPVIFQREIKGQLNDMQKKNINRLEKLILKIEKEIKRHKESFEDGSYDGFRSNGNYSEKTINTYTEGKIKREQNIIFYRQEIEKIKQ